MKPPMLARLLLLTVAGEAEGEFVAGDLHEEFLHLCATRGRPAGNRWYAWQVVRSVVTLLGLRLRSGEAMQLALAALSVAVPLLLLDRLWCFVYSQIPLKDGLDRAPGFLAVNVLYVCICSALCGSAARSFQRAILIAAVTAAAAAFALWPAAGETPAIYVWLVLLTAPASSLLVFTWRRFG
ncbi:MAG TPA: hypothetical protein VIX89_05745 [Bryobacteraceae bacterium]